MGKRAKSLYGQLVCKKCQNGFMNRRQIAFVIDLGLWYLLLMVLGFVLGDLPLDDTVALLVSIPWWVTFFLKDGFAGHSPGKALMGVQVVDETTGQPAGFVASFKRNLPLIIPFLILLIAFQLHEGHRIGDGWAGTRVIWKEYRDRAPFTA